MEQTELGSCAGLVGWAKDSETRKKNKEPNSEVNWSTEDPQDISKFKITEVITSLTHFAEFSNGN